MVRPNRTIRLSDDEWEEIRRRATKEGLTIAAYLRAVVGDTPIRPGRQPHRHNDHLPASLEPVRAEADQEDLREPLSAHRNVRFTETEWTQVCERAELVGLSPRRFIRFAALGHRISGRLTSEAVRQLAGAANNLNQLARWANTTRRTPQMRRLEEVLRAVETAIGSLL